MTDRHAGVNSSNSDEELIHAVLDGHSHALDALIRRHQGFIYNVAVRMLCDPVEAEDASQEILIKIVTSLDSFRGEAAFRTWAYRIAANHLLNWRRGRVERLVSGFAAFAEQIDGLEDSNLGAAVESEAEKRLLEEETRLACLSGMLLCLDRAQRLTFILGEVFTVSDVVGGEVLAITRHNFRQRLARARHQLYTFMRGKCGLVDPKNPCRCTRKTRAAIRAGIVDPKNLRFVAEHVATIERSRQERSRVLARVVGTNYASLFRDQDRKAPPDLVVELRAMLLDPRLGRALDLNNDRGGPPPSTRTRARGRKPCRR